MSFTIKAYESTNFGNNDLVWNVPHPDYDFGQHTEHIFNGVNIRHPKFTNMIVVRQEWDDDFSYIDYLTVFDGASKVANYFVTATVPERGNVIFSVMLDVITSYDVLSTPISGVLVRKHDTSNDEDRFDYPTALTVEGNYAIESYDFVSYSSGVTRLVESAVNLSQLGQSVTIDSGTGKVTVPTLLKPSHSTVYKINTWGGGFVLDNNRAFTLYLNDNIDENILNTVRGLSGDGAISDSYAIPTEAVTITNNGAEITQLESKIITKTTSLKMELDTTRGQPKGATPYVPKNEAIKGMFAIRITSTQEKNSLTFQAWDIKNSVDNEGYIQVDLWSDCKPSGTPFCCPTQVETLDPAGDDYLNRLATFEVKSVRGGQWLRNPLIYSTAKGEIFSTVETQLQRERAEYENKSALFQLEMSKRERDVRIAQADFNYQSGQLTNIISGVGSLASKDVGGALTSAKGIIDSSVNKAYIDEMRAVQEYEQTMERQLISIAYSNNLKNLNVQEALRRIVPREVVFQSNESLGGYEGYNGFTVTVIQPDLETLKAKDIEYSKYGYPVYETVTDFNMLDNLRQNHTVFQFEKPTISKGGKIGDMIREVLQGGIRICSQICTPENLLNNPKL